MPSAKAAMPGGGGAASTDEAPNGSAFANPAGQRAYERGRLLLYADALPLQPSWLEDEVRASRNWCGVMLTVLAACALAAIFTALYALDLRKPDAVAVQALSLSFAQPPLLYFEALPDAVLPASVRPANASDGSAATLVKGKYVWNTHTPCQQAVAGHLEATLRADTSQAAGAHAPVAYPPSAFSACPQGATNLVAGTGVLFEMQPALATLTAYLPGGSGVTKASGQFAVPDCIVANGSTLTVTGDFSRAASGLVHANHTAVWNGSQWLDRGNVFTPATFDTGFMWAGRMLFAGRDGGLYELRPDQTYAPFESVRLDATIATHCESKEGYLVVAGGFDGITDSGPGSLALSIAMWNGTAWSDISYNWRAGTYWQETVVYSVAQFNDVLYALGFVVESADGMVLGLAYLDEVAGAWTPVHINSEYNFDTWVNLLAGPTALYIIDPLYAYVVAWQGVPSTVFTSLCAPSYLTNTRLRDFIMWGDDLVVSGHLSLIGGVLTPGGVALWNGEVWESLDLPSDSPITRLACNATHLFGVGDLSVSTANSDVRFNGVAMRTREHGWMSVGGNTAEFTWTPTSNRSVGNVWVQQQGRGAPLALSVKDVLPPSTGERMRLPVINVQMQQTTRYDVAGAYGEIRRSYEESMLSYVIALGGTFGSYARAGCASNQLVLAGWGATCCFSSPSTFAQECEHMAAPLGAVVVVDAAQPVYMRMPANASTASVSARVWVPVVSSPARLGVALLEPSEVYSVVTVESTRSSVLQLIGNALGYTAIVFFVGRLLKTWWVRRRTGLSVLDFCCDRSAASSQQLRADGAPPAAGMTRASPAQSTPLATKNEDAVAVLVPVPAAAPASPSTTDDDATASNANPLALAPVTPPATV